MRLVEWDSLVHVIVLVELAYPSPVVGPYMYAGVVYRGEGVYLAEQLDTLLASVLAL